MVKPVYLDYAAATPVDPTVIDAMQPFWQDKFYNPSAIYLASRDVGQQLAQARARVAHWLGSQSEEIIFTAGATEANHIAIEGILKRYPDGNIAVSSTEHPAVLKLAEATLNSLIIPVNQTGQVDVDWLMKNITDKTVLISVHYANNETGSIAPIQALSRVVSDIRQQRTKTGVDLPLYLHSDATQAAQYLDLHVNRLGVDLMTISAGKIYGPKQVAALYVRGGIKLSPRLLGGGQERGLRSGTENVAGASGLAAALDLVQSDRHQEAQRIEVLRNQLQNALGEKVVVNGDLKHRLANFLHVSLPGQDGERLVMELDEVGVQAATGAACSANLDQPSHVLQAMGLKPDVIRGSVRFTLGRPTTEQQIQTAIKRIKSVIES